jgi:hypothetical protein
MLGLPPVKGLCAVVGGDTSGRSYFSFAVGNEIAPENRAAAERPATDLANDVVGPASPLASPRRPGLAHAPAQRCRFRRAPAFAVCDVESLTTHTQPHDAWVVRDHGSEGWLE